MNLRRYGFSMVMLLTTLASTFTHAADPWADTVVQYIPGTGISNDFVTGNSFENPLAALGEPTRFTSDIDNYGGVVTPLQSPFRSDEIVSIGKGGSLTVSFDEPVIDDPLNPFGIDLLIFGNSFLFGDTIFRSDFSFDPNGTFDGVASEGGMVELSANGTDFVLVTDLDADGLYPTNAYNDTTNPFATVPGALPSDFTKPVNPSLDIIGMTFAEVLIAYDGSGGGAGIDIGAWGFSQITHVRISNPADATLIPEIDGFADVAAVPEPTAAVLASLVLLVSAIRRRRSGTSI